LFQVVRGDLLKEPVEAIVNAANGHLTHGGGIAGIISRAAGPALQAESDALVAARGPLPTGSAVVTTAGALPFKGVIHAVGPRYGEGDPPSAIFLPWPRGRGARSDHEDKRLVGQSSWSGIPGIRRSIETSPTGASIPKQLPPEEQR
jgi:hypothetical protein